MKILNKISFVALLFCVFVAGSSAVGQSLSSSTATAGFPFTRNLTLGVRGDDVSALQQFLIAGGFLKISTPTGYFGPLTTAALGAWQASEGISPSVGFFGPISRGRINAAVQQALTDATQTQGTVGTTTTAVGTTSTAVINNGNGSPASPTGGPVRLKIPKLNIDAGFQYTGLKSDGTMEVPSNIFDVAWFTGSSRPGEKGNAIITGHVAQIRGGVMTRLGVFINLNQLSVGDKLSVLNDKGESITFAVREIRTYDPAADATSVFTSTDGGVHLNLITCEGSWVPSQLSYTQRLVVFTDLAQ